MKIGDREAKIDDCIMMTEAHDLKKKPGQEVRAEDREVTSERELREAIEVIEAPGTCEATGMTSQGDHQQHTVQTGGIALTGKMFVSGVSDCKIDAMVLSHLVSNLPLNSSVHIDNTMMRIFEILSHRDRGEEKPRLCDADLLKSCTESRYRMPVTVGAINVVAQVGLTILPEKF